MTEYTARCMKCKEQKIMSNPQEVIMKNNLKSMRGTCPVCGTKMCRIIGKA